MKFQYLAVAAVGIAVAIAAGPMTVIGSEPVAHAVSGSPIPKTEAEMAEHQVTYRETLEALDALQTAWQQDDPDAAALQSHADSLRERLTAFCNPYLPAKADASTAPPTAKQTPHPVTPQPATPTEARPSAERIKEYEEATERTHLAPDPAALQARIARRAAGERCHRAMELVAALDKALAARELDSRALTDALTELREIVGQLAKAPPPPVM